MRFPVLACVFLLVACAPAPVANTASRSPEPAPAPPTSAANDLEARSNARVEEPWFPPAPRVLIRGATVFTAAGPRLAPGYVVLENGRVAEVGAGDGPAPGAGTTVIEARGKFVTPGIIDPHSHIGVGAAPETRGTDDVNEATDPQTAGVRAENSFWPEDPSILRALAGGVTTIAVLPGSANLIGGRGVTMHLFPQRGARAMRFPGAPDLLKMACGENPKRVYGDQHRAPSTRMANVRNLREAFIKAQKYRQDALDYLRAHAAWEEKSRKGEHADEPKKPDRDLAMEALVAVLRGDTLVEWHCYRADDMLAALEVADEFGFRVRAFHHALEAYKIRDILAKKGVAVATWDDWWGFKMEAYDGIPENLALVEEAGGRAVVHSDSPIAIQLLNQAAGKALAAGRAAGVHLQDEDAIRWLTKNPAWALGIDDQVGTLERGKRADVVVWSANPLSSYARAEQVFVDGRPVFSRHEPHAAGGDFELGIKPEGEDL